VAAGDRQQADSAEAVQRMVPGAAMQGGPGLGQRAGEVTGQEREGIVEGQRAAVAVGQPCDRVRQLRALGHCAQRTEIRLIVAQVRAGRVIDPQRVEGLVRHGFPP
jgi:hypothetical protein